MSNVFVLDTDKQPLAPIHPGGARYLLKAGKAAVYRRYPFTIILRLPLETGSGGLTKYNRARQALPKTHWLDAAAVGASTPEHLHTAGVVPLLIKATGRGHRRVCNPNEIGLPVSHRKRRKRYFGYQTGDLVRAVVPERLACRGTHVGRVAVRARGTFTITTRRGKVTDVPYRFCTPVGRSDGYRYQTGERHAVPLPTRP